MSGKYLLMIAARNVLPATPARFRGAFNADAWKGSGRTSAGAVGYGKLRILHAQPCSVCMNSYYS